MENYRKKLKAQNIIFLICALTLTIVLILAFSGIIKPIKWKDYWNGMISGMSLAFIAIMLIGIIKNAIAMKNSRKLKKNMQRKMMNERLRLLKKAKA